MKSISTLRKKAGKWFERDELLRIGKNDEKISIFSS